MSDSTHAPEPSKADAEVFRALAELSPDIVSIINPDGTLRYNSKAAERIHGYTQEEMIGRNTIELIHEEDRDKVQSAMAKLTERQGNIVNVQYRYRNKDGNYAWMEAVASNELNNPHVRGLITISRDITERKKLEKELRNALDMRDEFISIASHELRTPLTALLLQIQTISRLNTLPESSAKIQLLADRAVKSIARLNLLVSDLLDVGRIRAGQLTLHKTKVDLKIAVENVLSLMSEEITNVGSSVKLLTEETIVGTWDGARIEQVIANLLSNAIKYGKGRPIELKIIPLNERRRAILSVRDQGMGIPESKQEKIFDRFERGPSKNKIEGLGLGLYISRQIVEAHGGTIRVESKPEAGALFIVELPL